MAERIVQQRELSVRMLARPALEHGSGINRSGNGSVDIGDDEIEVQRRPVSCVAACGRWRPFEGRGAGRFEEQINGASAPSSSTKPLSNRRPTLRSSPSV